MDSHSNKPVMQSARASSMSGRSRLRARRRPFAGVTRRSGAAALRSKRESFRGRSFTIFIDDDCLPPPELLDAGSYFVDWTFGDLAAISGIGNRFVVRPPAHLQIVHPSTSD
jgi:hypothetical protein